MPPAEQRRNSRRRQGWDAEHSGCSCAQKRGAGNPGPQPGADPARTVSLGSGEGPAKKTPWERGLSEAWCCPCKLGEDVKPLFQEEEKISRKSKVVHESCCGNGDPSARLSHCMNSTHTAATRGLKVSIRHFLESAPTHSTGRPGNMSKCRWQSREGRDTTEHPRASTQKTVVITDATT